MGGKDDPPKEKRSPVHTVAHLTDDFIDEMGIPSLPGQVPQRLERALQQRVDALLFRLKEAVQVRYVHPLEVRLVRETQRAVLTACELNVRDCEVHYARFRALVKELGYDRADAGFVKPRE